MANDMSSDQKAAVSAALAAGNSVTDVAKFLGMKAEDVASVARSLDIEPTDPTQKRAKALYCAAEGNSYQQIAEALRAEGHKTDKNKPVHYLTVSTWARNHGWAWGGSPDGEYVAPRPGAASSRSKYSLRLSKKMDREINSGAAVKRAAAAAWDELASDGTTIVQVAVIRGAAAEGVTDLKSVRKQLLEAKGDAIRSARA